MQEPELLLSEKGLVGYKKLEVSQNTTLLLSAYHFVWKPGTFQTAICSKPEPCRIGVKCTCGIYSAKSIEHLQHIDYMATTMTKGDFQMIVKLRLWGRIEEHTLGWRAEHARIEEILYVCTDETDEAHLERAAQFEATYEVPCAIYEIPEFKKGVTSEQYPIAPRQKPLTLQECIELYTLRTEMDLSKTELSVIKQRLRQFAYHKNKSVQKLSTRIQSFISQRAELQAEIVAIKSLFD